LVKVNTLRKQSKTAEEKWQKEKETFDAKLSEKSSSLEEMRTSHEQLESEITRLKVIIN